MMIPIGRENYIEGEEVVAILRPDSSPARSLRQKAEQSDRLINATNGRKARSLIVMRSNHVVLSLLQPRAVVRRFDRLNGPVRKNRRYPQSSLFDETNGQRLE